MAEATYEAGIVTIELTAEELLDCGAIELLSFARSVGLLHRLTDIWREIYSLRVGARVLTPGELWGTITEETDGRLVVERDDGTFRIYDRDELITEAT